MRFEKHTRDEQCTLGSDDVCTGCKVYHGEECGECQARGYHREGCPLIPKDLTTPARVYRPMKFAEFLPFMAACNSELAAGSEDEAMVRVAAQEWADAGFTVDEVTAWLEARCFVADAATALKEAGLSPAECRAEANADLGSGHYVDTVGFKVANGDLSVDYAARWIKAARS